jgi:phosphate-selective porin OprO and OprP
VDRNVARVGGAELSTFGTPHMTTHHNIIRLTAFVSLAAIFSLAPVAANAQELYPPKSDGEAMPEPAQSPLADNYAWEKNVVGSGEPTLAGPATAAQGSGDTSSSKPAADDPAALAKRVEALELYIKQLNAAASSETLPSPAKKDAQDKQDKTDAAAIGDCVPKKIDTIVKPTFTPSGRISFDGVTYDENQASEDFFNADRDNELGFRSFRIGGKGLIYENLFYTMEVELRGTNSSIAYKDIYMEQQELPVVGHLRAGHFKEPIGMEEFESDLYLTYMEKSPATSAFAPARNFGVMLWDTTDECQDTSWFLGMFRADSPDSPTNTGLWRSDNNDWCFDARAAWLPYYDDPSNGRYLVHLGGSYSFRHVGALTPTATDNQNVAYSTLNGLAEFTTRSWVGSQGPIGFGAEADTNEWNQINPEFLVIWGAASLQAEYYQLLMNSGEQFNGGYTFLSYFLTGENRGYRKDLKVIDRTQPLEPFFWVDSAKGQCCGWGAWELTAGYSWVNLDDGHDTVATTPANVNNRRRGFYDAVVFGVNWYQNPWSRMFFDIEHEVVNFVDAGVPNSEANIFGIRWQVDW